LKEAEIFLIPSILAIKVKGKGRMCPSLFDLKNQQECIAM